MGPTGPWLILILSKLGSSEKCYSHCESNKQINKKIICQQQCHEHFPNTLVILHMVMEVSYPKQAVLPAERNRGFTMYQEFLDYCSAYIPVFTQWWWENQKEEHCSIFHYFSRSFVVVVVSYSTYWHNFCISFDSSFALFLAAEELKNKGI